MLDRIKGHPQAHRIPASVRVLVLTAYGMDEYVYEALRADAPVAGTRRSLRSWAPSARVIS